MRAGESHITAEQVSWFTTDLAVCAPAPLFSWDPGGRWRGHTSICNGHHVLYQFGCLLFLLSGFALDMCIHYFQNCHILITGFVQVCTRLWSMSEESVIHGIESFVLQYWQNKVSCKRLNAECKTLTGLVNSSLSQFEDTSQSFAMLSPSHMEEYKPGKPWFFVWALPRLTLGAVFGRFVGCGVWEVLPFVFPSLGRFALLAVFLGGISLESCCLRLFWFLTALSSSLGSDFGAGVFSFLTAGASSSVFSSSSSEILGSLASNPSSSAALSALLLARSKLLRSCCDLPMKRHLHLPLSTNLSTKSWKANSMIPGITLKYCKVLSWQSMSQNLWWEKQSKDVHEDVLQWVRGQKGLLCESIHYAKAWSSMIVCSQRKSAPVNESGDYVGRSAGLLTMQSKFGILEPNSPFSGTPPDHASSLVFTCLHTLQF